MKAVAQERAQGRAKAQAGGPPQRRMARGGPHRRPEGAGVAWDRTGFVEDGGRLARERCDNKEYFLRNDQMA
jgi:hypothetical protein